MRQYTKALATVGGCALGALLINIAFALFIIAAIAIAARWVIGS